MVFDDHHGDATTQLGERVHDFLDDRRGQALERVTGAKVLARPSFMQAGACL
jgi:hypothetical protein